MITNADRMELIKYRIEQAEECIEEVEKLIDSDLLKVAVNRIYYCIYYVLTSFALKYKFETSKHLQLIGWFNKIFIKENLIPQKYGKIFAR